MKKQFEHTCDCERCKAHRQLVDLLDRVMTCPPEEFDMIRTEIEKIRDNLSHSTKIIKEVP